MKNLLQKSFLVLAFACVVFSAQPAQAQVDIWNTGYPDYTDVWNTGYPDYTDVWNTGYPDYTDIWNTGYPDYTNPTYTNPNYTDVWNTGYPDYTNPTYTTPDYSNPTTYTYTDPYTYTPTTWGTNPVTYPITDWGGMPNNGIINWGTTNWGTNNWGSTINTGVTINWGPIWNNPGTSCPNGTTYINGSCVITQTSCPTGSTLVNGVCVITNTNCPTGSTLVNGQCVINNTNCPIGSTLVNGVCQINTTTCPTGSTLVNGQCVLNSTICPSGSTLVNGVCVVNNTQCPTGSTLVNGQCVINNTTCPAGTTLVNGVCQGTANCPTGTTYVNGQCVGTTTCPSGTTLVNGVCQGTANCPTGTTYVNGQCVGTITCPANSTLINGVCQAPISCPTGTTYVNGVCQGTGTTVCPYGSTLVNGICQINTTSCPLGSILVNGICQISTYNCPIGTTLINGICRASTQTCWNGSIMPGNQVCPSQFKTCANGSVVPINQICYQTCPDGSTISEGSRCYNAPTYRPVTPTVKFNNVVTSVTTEITNTQARCNGIGLIANKAPSSGWFEYGETSSLGRSTTKVSIGSSATAPFSNMLTNLKPSTTYYCRAVMSNDYGVVKGEIVKFTTKAKTVAYVKPQAPVKTPTVTKKPVENKVVCVDGSYVTLDSKASSALLNQGQKLITLQVEKVQGDFVPGKDAIYRLAYKNISDAPLVNVLVKISLPQDVTFVGSTAGNYDPSNHSIMFGLPGIPPYSDGVITWTVRVKENADAGKTLVTTGYVLYMIPDANGKAPVQDEVTAYVVDTVSSASDISQGKETTSKKVIGKGGVKFLPQTLIEWLALLAILFIIAILGRSIYASFKQEANPSK